MGEGERYRSSIGQAKITKLHDVLYTALLSNNLGKYLSSVQGSGLAFAKSATLGYAGGQPKEITEFFTENLDKQIGQFTQADQNDIGGSSRFRTAMLTRFSGENKSGISELFKDSPEVKGEKEQNQKKLIKTRETAEDDSRSGANKGGVVPSGIKGDIPINVHAAEAILPLQGTYAHDSASLIGQGLLQPLVQWASSKMSGQLHSATMSRTSGSSSPPVMISNDNRSYSSGGGGKGAYPSVNSGPSIAGYEELFAKMTGVYAKGARV